MKTFIGNAEKRRKLSYATNSTRNNMRAYNIFYYDRTKMASQSLISTPAERKINES